MVYRAESDADALAFGDRVGAANREYAQGYVSEANCLTAAGVYAADLDVVVAAMQALKGEA